MRIRTLFALLLLGTATVSAAEPPRNLGSLIAQLGSEQYADREDAVRALDAIGGPALPLLRKAAASDDPEVRRRAAGLVRKIERRLDNAKWLVPTPFRLALRDATLADALTQLGEAVGTEFRFDGDAAKTADRKITLDTGEVSYWEAFDRFCQEAGVSLQSRTAQRRDSGVQQIIIYNGQIIRTDDPPDHRIVLVDGKPTPTPTADVGPVRLRALPPGTVVPGVSKAEGELQVALEAAIDPRLRWEKLVSLRVRRAVDDQGQELTHVVTPPAERTMRSSTSSVVIINGRLDSSSNADPALTAIRLRAGAKPTKKLTEVSGTVTGLMLLPVEKLLTVDDVLKAAGKSTEGIAGSAFKVVEATKDESGLVRVRAHVQPPVSDLLDGTPLYFTTRIIARGRMLGDEPLPLHNASYTLVDDKGQAYQLVDTETPESRGGLREVILTFLQKKGQGEPAKLEFRARRGVVVDLPFTLKDVPLP